MKLTPRTVRWANRLVIAMAALPLLQFSGCGSTFFARTGATFLNAVPRTIFNSALQLVISILNGTSNFLLQSGGSFGGGFGGS